MRSTEWSWARPEKEFVVDNDEDVVAMKPEELIDAWRKAERGRVVARRSVVLLIIVVIAVHVWLLCGVFTDFRDNKIPEFTEEITSEGARICSQLAPDLTDMANRLYPYCVSAFQKRMEKDWPVVRSLALSEMDKLSDHADKRWPDIEDGIVDVLSVSESAIEEELAAILGPEEAGKVASAYDEALKEEYPVVFSGALKEHIALAEGIGTKLERMLDAEPDIQPEIDMQEALGVMLELIGTELQKGI